jgi:hypothetical protein
MSPHRVRVLAKKIKKKSSKLSIISNHRVHVYLPKKIKKKSSKLSIISNTKTSMNGKKRRRRRRRRK